MMLSELTVSSDSVNICVGLATVTTALLGYLAKTGKEISKQLRELDVRLTKLEVTIAAREPKAE